MNAFTMTFDLPVVISVLGLAFLVGAAIIRNAIAIAATASRSLDNRSMLIEMQKVGLATKEKLEKELHDYQLDCAVTFVTTTNLKLVEDRLITAVNAFGAQLDRHTDRLDRLFSPVQDSKK